MHTKYCVKCPKNLAKQCELDLGQNTMPPCAKLVVESVNSLQQLKAEIAALADKVELQVKDGQWLPSIISQFIVEARQLSAV